MAMSKDDTLNSANDDGDLRSPDRRRIVLGAGLTAGGIATGGLLGAPAAAQGTPPAIPALENLQGTGKPTAESSSPWGYDTINEATPQPESIRPNEQVLPAEPRPYTDILSYHAHIYFDEDTHHKAALLRKWVAERFHVELGNWNTEPRGPHVTPSFYFGFTNDLLPVIMPWLQLNSLGLTILLHPNTDDPRADHLYYTAWINRDQPVNGYVIPHGPVEEDKIEQIYPNTQPTIQPETAARKR